MANHSFQISIPERLSREWEAAGIEIQSSDPPQQCGKGVLLDGHRKSVLS